MFVGPSSGLGTWQVFKTHVSFRLSLLVVQSYHDGHVLELSHFPKLPTFLVFPAWKVLPLGQPQPEQPGLASLWLCIRSRASDPRAGTETCDMRKGPQSGLFRFIKSLQFEDEPTTPGVLLSPPPQCHPPPLCSQSPVQGFCPDSHLPGQTPKDHSVQNPNPKPPEL